MQSNALSSGSKMSNNSNSTNGFSTEDDSRSSHDHVCCLIYNGDKCQRQAGNASYSKRYHNQMRNLKLTRDEMSSNIYICDYHKTQIQNIRTKLKRKEMRWLAMELVEADFYKVPLTTILRIYYDELNLPHRPFMRKARLADAIASHLRTIPVLEKERIAREIYYGVY